MPKVKLFFILLPLKKKCFSELCDGILKSKNWIVQLNHHVAVHMTINILTLPSIQDLYQSTGHETGRNFDFIRAALWVNTDIASHCWRKLKSSVFFLKNKAVWVVSPQCCESCDRPSYSALLLTLFTFILDLHCSFFSLVFSSVFSLSLFKSSLLEAASRNQHLTSVDFMSRWLNFV